ncbi:MULTISPECIES: DUF473 domain-containing protein [unclassified Methanoculleus]|uniref:DUF473 domain-containing protein n=1 Tax=unclassified Methanoculleus TaxID=2619537 RepID=UPI0025F7F6BA|nr:MULTISPECIES: DUF473 domain-containing protein [unclassified Methanoculleus]MCK9318314.1 DUF473 domain-containing protein [Methanoculleus sp.]MDD2253852.1 DUF473 domain-containing protein [Methanoculleus sp.]MDD2786536.1 DUF473 domain-containing protein [Methanoculleus sp.]MDD3215615.1 DUF473 domain-containing protein [Methanoculleus sp.]MDD4313465.1 DUF473 domain-containing protein [Methanoculleus sp.]
MKHTALTGISPAVIAELKSGKARTLELSSAHNIISLTETAPGECIFMTSVNEEDLSPGDAGIMVDLLVLNISMKRIEFVNPFFFEERERMSARIKVQFRGTTIARDVEGRKWGDPTKVEIIRSACYRAG